MVTQGKKQEKKKAEEVFYEQTCGQDFHSFIRTLKLSGDILGRTRGSSYFNVAFIIFLRLSETQVIKINVFSLKVSLVFHSLYSNGHACIRKGK